MILDIEKIRADVDELKTYFTEATQAVPPKPLEQEIAEEMDTVQYNQQKQDAKFLVKCYKYLKKLGYVRNQYQFSEQFLNKNNCANKNNPANCFYA